MTLYSYLFKKYGYDKPIILKELKNDSNISKKNLRQLLYSLKKKDKIERYSNGIYYFNKETIVGRSTLNFENVIINKYISNGEEIYGFFSGLYLLNLYDLTTQIPSSFEIITSKTSSKKREVLINGMKVIIKKSKIKITNENVKIIELLTIFKYLTLDEVIENKKRFIEIINEFKLNKDALNSYIPYFPKRVVELLIRSELIYEFASK